MSLVDVKNDLREKFDNGGGRSIYRSLCRGTAPLTDGERP